jgi:hypothetical protein
LGILLPVTDDKSILLAALRFEMSDAPETLFDCIMPISVFTRMEPKDYTLLVISDFEFKEAFWDSFEIMSS